MLKRVGIQRNALASRDCQRVSLPTPRRRCLVVAPAQVTATKPNVEWATKPKTEWNATDRIEYLKEDLSHLFDAQGIDPNGYDDVVDFMDPITKLSNLKGFLFNISMLKKVFNPNFILHDIKQTSENSITTRWTMDMEFTLAKSVPLLSKWWSPALVFTGTSEYVFNPATGRIFRHLDEWDSITQQGYLSIEGVRDFFSQLTALYSTPKGLETAPYTIMKRRSDYQIRQYEPFLVAECAMDTVAGQAGKSPAGPGTNAFGMLAGFIFGGNARKERMAMTTPVFSSSAGRMQFVIAPSAHKDMSSVPAPLVPGVEAKLQPGGLYAVRVFSGMASESSAAEEEEKLRASLLRDGELPQDASWQLARYNDPSVKPFLRRNEVLIPLERFELW